MFMEVEILPPFFVLRHCEGGEEFFDALVVLRANQQGIAGVHHYEIVQTLDSNKLGRMPDKEIAAAVAGQALPSDGDIPVFILFRGIIIDRSPVADIEPIEIARHNPGYFRTLQQAVVERSARAVGVGSLHESLL